MFPHHIRSADRVWSIRGHRVEQMWLIAGKTACLQNYASSYQFFCSFTQAIAWPFWKSCFFVTLYTCTCATATISSSGWEKISISKWGFLEYLSSFCLYTLYAFTLKGSIFSISNWHSSFLSVLQSLLFLSYSRIRASVARRRLSSWRSSFQTL